MDSYPMKDLPVLPGFANFPSQYKIPIRCFSEVDLGFFEGVVIITGIELGEGEICGEDRYG